MKDGRGGIFLVINGDLVIFIPPKIELMVVHEVPSYDWALHLGLNDFKFVWLISNFDGDISVTVARHS